MTVLNVQAGGHAFALKLKGEVWTWMATPVGGVGRKEALLK